MEFKNINKAADTTEQRHPALIEITSDLESLREMQAELAALIQQQGEQISHIEDVVVITSDRVAGASQDLECAVEYQKSYNKTRMIVLAGATGMLLLTTPILGVGVKVLGPIAYAAYVYPKVSIPIGALLALKYTF